MKCLNAKFRLIVKDNNIKLGNIQNYILEINKIKSNVIKIINKILHFNNNILGLNMEITTNKKIRLIYLVYKTIIKIFIHENDIFPNNQINKEGCETDENILIGKKRTSENSIKENKKAEPIKKKDIEPKKRITEKEDVDNTEKETSNN